MDRDTRLKRLKFRSWHRGTKEADLMIGGYFDAHSHRWSDAEIDWYEEFIEEQDVDIMAWALQVQPVPPQFDHPVLHAMRAMDFVPVAPR
ncbi:FAD assembly factor SdhE [Sphingomonas sp. CFBP 13720]|jgi:antitoxin CptB|uniref:FAD assembly factor SdhE n=1 Tax=Sphingomonas sp. CFBP 13720 TaxID=2775302 RepID=UPI001782F72A|nr:succinate dehydrogenase assembly factor 2 [Sphingomonas sp. CFBP 13720]MBD8677505.1 succinate dehydrogenase assembly factor 2 [Sphingomonas sp. CFBP 13720]